VLVGFAVGVGVTGGGTVGDVGGVAGLTGTVGGFFPEGKTGGFAFPWTVGGVAGGTTATAEATLGAEGTSGTTGTVAGAVAKRLGVGAGVLAAEAEVEVACAPGDFRTNVYVPIPMATKAKNAPIPRIMPELERCDGTPETDEASWRSSPPDWLPFWGMKPPAPGAVAATGTFTGLPVFDAKAGTEACGGR
jgi:hypothetical protein